MSKQHWPPDWPELEVVVVDDRSDDGTGDVARQAAEGDPRLRVVEGVEPPSGWAGNHGLAFEPQRKVKERG